MKLSRHLLLVALLLFTCVESATKEEWKSRSIYQVMTDRFHTDREEGRECRVLDNYCGGTFKGLEHNLDYIKDMGFDAIIISPVVSNTEEGYHGYHMKDLYEINRNFGSVFDLQNLVAAAHEKGIWVMVEVVVNHVGPVGTDFGQINPLNNASHYHDECLISPNDYINNDWNVKNCRIDLCPDLNTEDEFVKAEFYKWIRWLVDTFNIDGIRVDSMINVPTTFWPEF